MKICLIVSFFFHGAFVLAFHEAFPWAFAEKELRTYKVEFIRPPVEDLEKDDLSDGEMGKAEEKKAPETAETQDTISLDTRDKRYVSYARVIRDGIARHWKYPPEARENLIEGKLMVLFSLGRNGDLQAVRILTSSGYTILDDEAVRAIRAAAPFPSFPGHITVNRLNIKANIDYRIASRR